MRPYRLAIAFTLACSPLLSVAQQAATMQPSMANQAPATPTPATSAPANLPAISGSVQPSIDTLTTAVNLIKVDKWKGGSVRTEASGNISSIQKDLQATLPGLLSDSDGSPGSISKLLPVSRNLGALYAVVIRVWDGARIAAPGEQVDQLQQAMTALDKARRAVDDRLQTLAAGSEKAVGDLQISLAKAQAAPVCPVVAVAPPPPPATPKKKVVKKKPAASTTPKPTNTTGTTAAPGAAPAKPAPQQ
jgi:hypothetical protein